MVTNLNSGEGLNSGEIVQHYAAEQALIGCILLDADTVLPEAEMILDYRDFFFSELGTLYKTMSGYWVDGKEVDVVTVTAQLGKEYSPIIAGAMNAVPHIHNWRSYAQIVIDSAKRRRAMEYVQSIHDAILEDCEVSECQQLAVSLCESLSTTTNDHTFSAKEGFSAFYKSLKKPTSHIQTGFAKLDQYLCINKGDFIVVGARPSVGKTALTLQMLLKMSREMQVVYFSLETSANNLFGRMAASLSGIPLGNIKRHIGINYDKIDAAGREIKARNLHIVEAAGWTIQQIKAKAVQLKAEVIFIDYMGLISDNANSRYEKLTNISVGLHTLAQQSGIAVIALSQLNRGGNGEPTMETLRESGQIEQDADAILLLHAPNGIEARNRKIIIAKNKEGKVGFVDFDFDGKIQRFIQLEDRY